MTMDRQLIRGVSSFTSGAAKWGATGRASGVYNISNSTGFWPNNANIPDSTIECWFKNSSAVSLTGSSTQMLMSRFKYYWLGLDSQGVNLYYGLDSAVNNSPAHGALIFPGALCDGQWHHVAAVFSGGGGTAYCDGVRLGSDIATPVGTGTDIESLGGYGNTSEAYDWSGSIDEVRYSNIARYSGSTYTVPTGPFTVDANTIALYHLDGSTADSTLSQAPPTAAFAVSVSQLTGIFSGASSASSDSPIESYLWDFGDGSQGTGISTIHSYEPGTYTATLTVIDEAGNTGTVSHDVTVAALTIPTDHSSIVADTMKTLLEASAGPLGLTDIWYGDQARIPNIPAACVDTGTKKRALAGYPFQTEQTIIIYIILYGQALSDSETGRHDLDQLAEAVEGVLHQHIQMGGTVIQGFVTENQPGFKVQSGKLMLASRLVWEGMSKVILPTSAP